MRLRLVLLPLLPLWVLLTVTAMSTRAMAHSLTPKKDVLILDTWVRLGLDFAVYENRETGLRIAPVMTTMFSYTRPGDGPTLAMIGGLQIGDRTVDIAPLGGVSLFAPSGLARGLIGWRGWARLPHHVTFWNETLFYLWQPKHETLPHPQEGQKVLSQTEVTASIDRHHRFELGGKILVEGDPKNARREMSVLAGPIAQFFILMPKNHGEGINLTPAIRLDLAYKIGLLQREGRAFLGHEIEGELVFYFRSGRSGGTHAAHRR